MAVINILNAVAIALLLLKVHMFKKNSLSPVLIIELIRTTIPALRKMETIVAVAVISIAISFKTKRRVLSLLYSLRSPKR